MSQHENIKWNKFEDPRPYTGTSLICFDKRGRFPIIFRGPHVRSVKNCWSIPSGLHEAGLTLAQNMAKEIKEECNLSIDPQKTVHVGLYENIVHDERWHWVMHILVASIEDFDGFKNLEPAKHTDWNFIQLEDIESISPWAPALKEALLYNLENIIRARDMLLSLR